MRKIAYGLLTSVLFFGGASLAFANISADPNATTTPQSQFGAYCAPYSSSFISGGYYTPIDNGICTYELTAQDMSSTSIFLASYKGTAGSATLANFDLGPTLPQSIVQTQSSIWNGSQGDDFFTVAVPYNDSTQVSDADNYFQHGGTAPLMYDIIPWKWGVAPNTTLPLTVTADAQTVQYGGAFPSFTATLSGFLDGVPNDVTGAANCTTTAVPTSSTGMYTVTCTVGTLTSQNYSFGTFFPGLFTIVQAPLTVTADDQTMIAGAAVPTLTTTLSGFVNGESLATSGVTGGASCSTGATSASPAGTYPISCTVGSLASNNYTFATFVDGTLTVTAPMGPTVTITDPIANQAYEKSDSVILGVTVVDTARIVATTTLLNGAPFNPTQPIPFFTASPGTSTVTVTVRDANGLSATASVSFLITRPGGNECYTEAEGWWNRGWVWTSDDFYHVLLDCSDLDQFHRDRHDLENNHNHDNNWKQEDKQVSDGVKARNDDMDKRVHKNGH